MLIQTRDYLIKSNKDPRNISFGQENNLGTWAICKMNMFLHSLLMLILKKGTQSLIQNIWKREN